jgi:hypothetical protein
MTTRTVKNTFTINAEHAEHAEQDMSFCEFCEFCVECRLVMRIL